MARRRAAAIGSIYSRTTGLKNFAAALKFFQITIPPSTRSDFRRVPSAYIIASLVAREIRSRFSLSRASWAIIQKADLMDPEWLAKFKPLSDVLMEYGWFVAPYIIGAEFRVIEGVVEHVKNHPPQTSDDRRVIETMIHDALCEPVYHPNYRARAVWLGLKLDHFREYSHIYESGIFAYYKRDYIGSALCLTAAMEGILLSFYGWKRGSSRRKPSIPKLIRLLRSAEIPYKSPDLSIAHNMYRDILADFLDKWLYRDTNESDFSLSLLNRHLILHGLEPGNFYRPEDVHRLILVFDLVVDFLAVRRKVFHVFLPNPGTDLIFDKRHKHYFDLAMGLTSTAQCWNAERDMLKDHPNYVSPTDEPNFAKSLAHTVAQLIELQKIARKPVPGGPSDGKVK